MCNVRLQLPVLPGSGVCNGGIDDDCEVILLWIFFRFRATFEIFC